MAEYEPFYPEWRDFESGGTPFTAEAAEHLEAGIASAHEELNNLPDPNDGAPGKSAYELAVDNGFSGTVTEWLASLKGEPGADGAPTPAEWAALLDRVEALENGGGGD